MSRLARAWLALALGVLWFWGGPAEGLAERVARARAEELRSEGAGLAVEGVLRAADGDPDALPRGAAALALAEHLRAALSHEDHTARWSEGALALLDDAQRAAVKAGADRPPLPPSRSNPRTPAELVRLVERLSAQVGAVSDPPPPPPDQDPLPGLSPVARARGLLTLVESGSPPLSPAQARAIQAAALGGVRAHEALYAEVNLILSALDPTLLASMPRLGERHDPARAEAALSALRRRGE